MQLIRHLHFFPHRSVVTVGNFDGMHRGHLDMLTRLRKYAKEKSLPTVLVLFEPQPREVLTPLNAPLRLTSLREKLRLLGKQQIDYVVCLPFTKQLAELSADDFVKHILVDKLHVAQLVVGEDFRFGKERKGDCAYLKALSEKYHFSVACISALHDNHERISSTWVRQALSEGDMKSAEYLLGRPYTVSGRVCRGAGRGHQWGFPTANIKVPRSGLPLHGVFIVRVSGPFLHHHPAVANIGTRPTIDGTSTILEVLLLDFSGDLYGQRLEIEFLQKLRDEKKFDHSDLLLSQIKKDVIQAKAFFTFYAG